MGQGQGSRLWVKAEGQGCGLRAWYKIMGGRGLRSWVVVVQGRGVVGQGRGLRMHPFVTYPWSRGI